MTNLKHQSFSQLRKSKADCKSEIAALQNKLYCQRIRLVWIDEYINNKETAEMSLEEIEEALGYKVVIKC